MIESLTSTEGAAIDAGQCPDCGGMHFLEGPHGGACVNIMCRDCHAKFNITPGIKGAFGKQRLERPSQQPPGARLVGFWTGQGAQGNIKIVVNGTQNPETACLLIARERARQIAEEKFTAEHDDRYVLGDLFCAAAAYLNAAALTQNHEFHLAQTPPKTWPWPAEAWKPSPDTIRNLVKAGALIAAEIDRLQRMDPEFRCDGCGWLSFDPGMKRCKYCGAEMRLTDRRPKGEAASKVDREMEKHFIWDAIKPGTILRHVTMGECKLVDPRPGSPFVTVTWPRPAAQVQGYVADYPSDVRKADIKWIEP